MRRFALIQNNKAHWVFEAEQKPEFAPDIVLIDITDHPEVQEGWDYDSTTNTFINPDSLDKVKAIKLKEIAEERWKAETGGLTLPNGVVISTDRESQALITGAALKDLQDPDYVCWWKGKTGWVQLNAETILAIAEAVREHVQRCFDRERELALRIETTKTVEEALSVSWEAVKEN